MSDTNSHRLNPAVRGLAPSATLSINEHSARLQAEGRQVFRFGFGQSPFPIPGPVVRSLQRHAHEKAYLPVQGLLELRQSISAWYQRTEGLNVSPDQIMIGPGSKELMFLLQMTLRAEILIPAPSWVSYAPQAGLFGRKIVWLQTDIADAWRITPQQLIEACRADPSRTRLLILNYPSNPTGASYSAEQLEALAEAARDCGVLILADEIYSGLNFSGTHTSISRYYPEGTIVSNGLSKWCGAGGWRLGLFIFPAELEWLRGAMVTVASETYSSVAAPVQYAAISAFDGGAEIDAYLNACRRIMQIICAAAAVNLRSAGISVSDAEGGFYLFPRFPKTAGVADSAKLCRRVLEQTGVAMLPGSDFGQSASDLTARIALVDFDGSAALEALLSGAADSGAGDQFLTQYCPRVLTGVERLIEWCTT